MYRLLYSWPARALSERESRESMSAQSYLIEKSLFLYSSVNFYASGILPYLESDAKGLAGGYALHGTVRRPTVELHCHHFDAALKMFRMPSDLTTKSCLRQSGALNNACFWCFTVCFIEPRAPCQVMYILDGAVE